SENRPRRGRFLPISPPHGCSMGQEIGKKGAGAVDLQPTIPKSDRLLEIITAHLMEEEDDESLKLKILNAISGQTP
ncbi:MAG: hypothetical protein Q8K59_09115, partial [Nitrosomonas sp.]|nr:hypothetical protein [Nitrosomonas sp.]MDP1951235.1 hypothetical protein [Nitrosomonas sp.]